MSGPVQLPSWPAELLETLKSDIKAELRAELRGELATLKAELIAELGKPEPATEPDVMTVQEMATYLRIGKNKAYALINAGTLPARIVDGKRFISRANVEAWSKESTLKPGALSKKGKR